MIIHYKEEFFDANYVNELPDKLERIKHDKKLMEQQIRLL